MSPMFAYYYSQFGMGSIGGRLYEDSERLGARRSSRCHPHSSGRIRWEQNPRR